jgi:tetratricopeptide (TPR) repeat protein
MPKLNGIEFLRICKTTPELGEIPFLMVTSQSSIERMKILQAARANVDQYMLKPFNLEEFRTRIMEVLEHSKVSEECRKLVHAGFEFLENGHFQNSLIQFEEALKLQPENEAALRGMAESVLQVRGVEAALPYFKKAIDVNPIYPKTYIQLSQLYEKLNYLDKAIALLESAVKHVSFNSDLHFALGRLYYVGKFFAEAKQEFEKTLEIQADHPEAKLYLQKLTLPRKGT